MSADMSLGVLSDIREISFVIYCNLFAQNAFFKRLKSTIMAQKYRRMYELMNNHRFMLVNLCNLPYTEFTKRLSAFSTCNRCHVKKSACQNQT